MAYGYLTAGSRPFLTWPAWVRSRRDGMLAERARTPQDRHRRANGAGSVPRLWVWAAWPRCGVLRPSGARPRRGGRHARCSSVRPVPSCLSRVSARHARTRAAGRDDGTDVVHVRASRMSARVGRHSRRGRGRGRSRTVPRAGTRHRKGGMPAESSGGSDAPRQISPVRNRNRKR